MSDKVIFCAYAEKENMESGANLANVQDKSSVYWKNAVVALYSAKQQHPECDVVLVTNVEVPKTYLEIIRKTQIKIYQELFDSFVFQKSVWGLAFYKLCAIKKMLQKEYEYYLMLDTDVYVQSRMDDLFEEMDYNIMLHDRHPRLSNSTELKENKEYRLYCGEKRPISKWGGGIYRWKKR